MLLQRESTGNQRIPRGWVQYAQMDWELATCCVGNSERSVRARNRASSRSSLTRRMVCCDSRLNNIEAVITNWKSTEEREARGLVSIHVGMGSYLVHTIICKALFY